MQSYTAPLADFRFLLEDVFDYPGELPQHHVALVELGQPPDHTEEVGVHQEVLPQLAVGVHAELAQAAQARLGRELGRDAHHPNSRAAVPSTAASSSS